MVATGSPSPRRVVQLARLWGMTCTASQAALEGKRPEGRWLRPTLYFRSRQRTATLILSVDWGLEETVDLRTEVPMGANGWNHAARSSLLTHWSNKGHRERIVARPIC